MSASRCAPVLRLCPDRETQSREMAAYVAERLRAAIRERHRAALAVSGGRSPVAFFEALRCERLTWDQVTVLLVDERVVPLNHPDSNAALVQRHLRQGAASAACWLPLLDPDGWGDTRSADAVDPTAGAARSALAVPAGSPDEDTLASLAERADAGVSAAVARLDVAVLGMGEDGHTASLFPDDPRRAAWSSSHRHVDWARPATAPHARLTLTLPFLQAARTLVLGLQGPTKRAVFERACLQPTTDLPLSLLLVPPAAPMQVWLTP